MAEAYFEVETPLGFSIHCTRQHWDFIVREKHPIMAGEEDAIRQVLRDPDEVRKSRKDERVLYSTGGEVNGISARL